MYSLIILGVSMTYYANITDEVLTISKNKTGEIICWYHPIYGRKEFDKKIKKLIEKGVKVITRHV